MRHDLWISGSSAGTTDPGTRSNALWGKGRRRYTLLLALAVVGTSIVAGATTASSTAAPPRPPRTEVPTPLTDRAKARPNETIPVIIQTADPSRLDKLDDAVEKARKKKPGKPHGINTEFDSIGAVAADLTGEQVTALATDPTVKVITEDAGVQATGGYGNSQDWIETVGAQWGDAPKGTEFPTIAIVDSGVEGRDDFGKRLLKSVDFTSRGSGNGGSGGDGFGHGTLVAGLAIGGEEGFTGTEPHGKIVSLDVLDNSGNGRVSSILAACDWILKNKDKFNIGIANFSINAGGGGAGAANDPVNKAVERLWLNGIVVVAAAGNYAVDGAESGVGFAPANDPFVITVGAADTNGTAAASDDFAAPWSAWGMTQDGFRKPELAAPGRSLNGPVAPDSTMMKTFPTRKVAEGYMWMSGTSFAAPLVSGAAATILSRHPDWTPDQVKGALMSAADVPAGYGSAGPLGVGILDVADAIKAGGQANPNAGLARFVTNKSFDAAAWAAAAAADPAWNAASWSSASWSSASWSSASWSSASWSSASWSSASWSSASWSSASWSSMFAAE